jgi:hypothetical protein
MLSGVQGTGKKIDTPRGRREGMKTNDVTGRFKRGFAGVALEFGRPVLGTRLRDVEKVARALGALGVEFERLNAVTGLMEDPGTGKFKEDVIHEKVASAFLEVTVELGRLPQLFDCIKKISLEIETVVSIDLITRVNSDGSIPTESLLEEGGLWIAPNGKTCIGLGRPLAQED